MYTYMYIHIHIHMYIDSLWILRSVGEGSDTSCVYIYIYIYIYSVLYNTKVTQKLGQIEDQNSSKLARSRLQGAPRGSSCTPRARYSIYCTLYTVLYILKWGLI